MSRSEKQPNPQNDTLKNSELEEINQHHVIAVLKSVRSSAERGLGEVARIFSSSDFGLKTDYLLYSPLELSKLTVTNSASAWENAYPKILTALESAYLWDEFIAELAGLSLGETQQILENLVEKQQVRKGERLMGDEPTPAYYWASTVAADDPDIQYGANLMLSNVQWDEDELYR